ncbi:MAG: hypothetical protein ACR2PG_07645 [Hyphomicrobiaceae bacterium]
MTRMVDNADNDNAERVEETPTAAVGGESSGRETSEEFGSDLIGRMISGSSNGTRAVRSEFAADNRDRMEIGTARPRVVGGFARNFAGFDVEFIGPSPGRDVTTEESGAALVAGDQERSIHPTRSVSQCLQTGVSLAPLTQSRGDLSISEALSLEALGLQRPSRDPSLELIFRQRPNFLESTETGDSRPGDSQPANKHYESSVDNSATAQPGFVFGLIAAALTGAMLYAYLV